MKYEKGFQTQRDNYPEFELFNHTIRTIVEKLSLGPASTRRTDFDPHSLK